MADGMCVVFWQGAVVTRAIIDDTSICFVNCHLAAGHSHVSDRNNDVLAILSSPVFSAGVYDGIFLDEGDGSLVTDHSICILSGDLNYRIDKSRAQVMDLILRQDWTGLRSHDQLCMQRLRNP